LSAARDDVQHSEVLARGGGEHESMPDRSVVRQSVPTVEHDADGVENASSDEQDEGSQRDRGDQAINRDKDDPAEQKLGSD
jgi:hypothetical protein